MIGPPRKNKPTNPPPSIYNTYFFGVEKSPPCCMACPCMQWCMAVPYHKRTAFSREHILSLRNLPCRTTSVSATLTLPCTHLAVAGFASKPFSQMCYVSIADPNFILVPENQIEGGEEEEFSHHSMCLKLFCLLFF